MNIAPKIILLFFYLSPIALFASETPNQLRRLPSYDGIQEGGFEGCSNLPLKILDQGNWTLDNYGTQVNHHRTIKEIKLSSRQQHGHCNWHCYTQQLTSFLDRQITDDDHRRAAQLYCILKNNPDAQKHNNITEDDLHCLSSCAAWGAVDAIKNYESKKQKTETNELSWLDYEYWLLPSVKTLKEKIHQEIAKIPAEMMDIYTTTDPNGVQHSIARFLQKEQKTEAKKQQVAQEDALKKQDAAEIRRIQAEYDIIDFDEATASL
ncbi:MAG: hypothetical protein Q8Q60_05050 [Candidatus Chromulinivorax sp.]|nr:hypothetical protein [Candidatus Chromulinivorax sp.]